MPYDELRRAGLKIGLGTDVAGGPSLSMFRQMGEALNSANHASTVLTPAGALYLATLGGAEVLHIKDAVGSLDAGKDADFIVINPQVADPMGGTGPYQSPEEVLSRLCFRADKASVEFVYLRGDKGYPCKPPAHDMAR
jgi:guanine deaminase